LIATPAGIPGWLYLAALALKRLVEAFPDDNADKTSKFSGAGYGGAGRKNNKDIDTLEISSCLDVAIYN